MYVVILWLALNILGPMLVWLGGYLLGGLAGNLAIALVANVLMLRMFSSFTLVDLGFRWNRASMDNIALGLLGGAGTACLVLAPPLLTGAAHISATPNDLPNFSAFLYITVLMAVGAMGEEVMMRGYGFQILIARCGAWATIIPVGVVFAAMHAANPHSGPLALANTAAFGILFGYAFLRSRDLWLPAGLHFGWNITLPLFGVNVSGLNMKMTGHEMTWSAGTLWSGGEYGPEASVLTSIMMVVLAVYLWKAPIRRQVSPILDPPAPADGRQEE